MYFVVFLFPNAEKLRSKCIAYLQQCLQTQVLGKKFFLLSLHGLLGLSFIFFFKSVKDLLHVKLPRLCVIIS